MPVSLKRVLIGLGTPIGVVRHNWTLLEIMSRPWWLYRSGGRLPAGRIARRQPRPVADADIALCERLLAAFSAATSADGAAGESHPGIWAWILNTHQRQLAETLEHGDPSELARLLASMFQRDFVWGIAHGGHRRESESWLGAHILRLKSLDVLVSLAEAVGASTVENPEQGTAGLAFDEGVQALLSRIDEALGIRLDAPDAGAPFGLALDGRVITLEMPEHIYAALRLKLAIQTHLRQSAEAEAPARIVEIGGGFGGVCYWFLRMCPAVARYTIVDLPIMGVLQGYFLAQTLGPQTVSLLGEPPAKVMVLPDSALAQVQTPFEVLLNMDSMPEMPNGTMIDYLEWARANCEGIFYSYNQEAGADFLGQKQGLVPQAVEEVGGFTRIRRDASWLRRGYAEEIYACRPRARRP